MIFLYNWKIWIGLLKTLVEISVAPKPANQNEHLLDFVSRLHQTKSVTVLLTFGALPTLPLVLFICDPTSLIISCVTSENIVSMCFLLDVNRRICLSIGICG